MTWNRIKWLLLTFIQFKKTAYPRTQWGVKLCVMALPVIASPAWLLRVNFVSSFIRSLEITPQDASLYAVYTAIFICLIGWLLIYSELNVKTRHTAKAFISAMPGVAHTFPDEVLDPTEKEFCREAVALGAPQGKDENIEQQVKRYNAELEADIFKRFILHEKCQKLYIGGLARVPFLIAYGAFLRNISSEILYYDKLHENGRWSLLSDENEQISFTSAAISKRLSLSGDAGLAIGFSTPILEAQLPPTLQNATTILQPDAECQRNLIKNQTNLTQLSAEVGRLIDQLSALPGCKKVHLFLSVQSAFALELGRRFQEGTHKNWVIHNFNPATSSYDWALELSRDGVCIYNQLSNDQVKAGSIKKMSIFT